MEELTPETIAELVEVSFVQSCLQLAGGYVDVLKLFIAAVKSAHDLPMSLDELRASVGGCAVRSAGRELLPEEEGLRREWMAVVYGMLDALSSSSPSAGGGEGGAEDADDESADGSSTSRVDRVVRSVVAVREEMQTLEEDTGGKVDAASSMGGLTVDELKERSSTFARLMGSCEDDPVEKAFVTNDARVALMTLRVLEEERLCTEGMEGGSNDKSVPRPNIPGTG